MAIGGICFYRCRDQSIAADLPSGVRSSPAGHWKPCAAAAAASAAFVAACGIGSEDGERRLRTCLKCRSEFLESPELQAMLEASVKQCWTAFSSLSEAIDTMLESLR